MTKKSYTREYKEWQKIKTACYNKGNPRYKTYGARGVRVCDRWLQSAENFIADVGACPSDCTGIELIDLNGDFEKHNVRWVGEHNRRKLKDMPNQKNKGLRSKYKKPCKVSMTFESEYVSFLERQAIEQSRKEKKIITVAEMLRRIILDACPMPKQGEFKLNKKGE